MKKFQKLKNWTFKKNWYVILCFACDNYNIVLICRIYTHIHTSTHIHTHTHTHTHAQRNTYTDLNFTGFWKDCKIKYTRNWDNDGPQNLIHAKFKFLIKTSDLRKILGKLRETKIFALTKQNNWKLQGEEIYFWRSFMLLACNFIKKWTLSQDYLKDFA